VALIRYSGEGSGWSDDFGIKFYNLEVTYTFTFLESIHSMKQEENLFELLLGSPLIRNRIHLIKFAKVSEGV
jgi:hypothetical protein